uniref:Uncharacterized protein n=1 Tax=Opuntia streptacantha TaxID=393608 RepID=A0A7C9ESI1_OPUST
MLTLGRGGDAVAGEGGLCNRISGWSHESKQWKFQQCLYRGTWIGSFISKSSSVTQMDNFQQFLMTCIASVKYIKVAETVFNKITQKNTASGTATQMSAARMATVSSLKLRLHAVCRSNQLSQMTFYWELLFAVPDFIVKL